MKTPIQKVFNGTSFIAVSYGIVNILIHFFPSLNEVQADIQSIVNIVFLIGFVILEAKYKDNTVVDGLLDKYIEEVLDAQSEVEGEVSEPIITNKEEAKIDEPL